MTANHLVESSLDFCCHKEQSSRNKVIQKMQQGYEDIHSNFRYALAKKLCLLLQVEQGLRAVYVYGSTVKDNARISSDIDLVLHVEKKDHRLHLLIEKLNSELLTYYKRLVGEQAVNVNRFLDVQLVDDHEVQNKRGYATLITSLYNRPLKIWDRAS